LEVTLQFAEGKTIEEKKWGGITGVNQPIEYSFLEGKDFYIVVDFPCQYSNVKC
jgi:hypothetical protein